jgi:Transglutaminase-like superfamily
MPSDLRTSLAYYAQHGFMTEPGAHAHLLTDLPHEVPLICEIVQGLIIHYRGGDLYNVQLPLDRLEEARTRHVARILNRICELADQPLTIPRPPHQRFIGCCRDFATLFCSILRSHQVPARVRCGFSTYFDPGFCFDHWIAEYWNADEQRWIRVDVEMDAIKRAHNKLTFDPCDVPEGQFLLAGHVWQACRNGALDPARFGYEPEMSGMWVIRNYLLYDLACLNKMELTPWDFWGLSDIHYPELTEADLAVLDQVAAVTIDSNETFQATRALYQNHAQLHVPAVITSYTLDDKKTRVLIGGAPEP